MRTAIITFVPAWKEMLDKFSETLEFKRQPETLTPPNKVWYRVKS